MEKCLVTAGQSWKPWLSSRLLWKHPGREGETHFTTPGWMWESRLLTYFHRLPREWGSSLPLSGDESLASYAAFSCIAVVGRVGAFLQPRNDRSLGFPLAFGEGLLPQFFLFCLPEIDQLLSKSCFLLYCCFSGSWLERESFWWVEGAGIDETQRNPREVTTWVFIGSCHTWLVCRLLSSIQVLLVFVSHITFSFS